VADGLEFEVETERRALNDADAWAQEYELQWLDEASAWLDFDTIGKCEHEQAGLSELYAGGAVFAGLDIARRNDLFVLWISELVGDVLWSREITALRRATFETQHQVVSAAFSKYRILRLCVDQTGMGEPEVEFYQRQHGTHTVEGVLFTPASKLELANAGKQRFEDRLIRVPVDDKVRADLHSLKKETSVSGAPRFIADGSGDGHADRAWACFLSCYAAAKITDLSSDGYVSMPKYRHEEDEPENSLMERLLGWRPWQ
jgi:phage FluMu gp28-like protein